MSRSTTLLRAAVVAVGATALLAGCFAPAVVPVEPPKPEPDFGTIGGDAPVPIETGTPIDPVNSGTSGFTAVIDDLGVLTVSVPSDWTEVNGVPFTTNAGQEWASITVSSDIQGYLDSWSVSGLEIAATPVQNGTSSQLLGLLDSITGIYDSCATVVQEAKPYDDGFFQGFESAYEGCGNANTFAFAITAMNTAGTQALFVRSQVTADHDANEVYLQVVKTFDTSVGRGGGRR